MPGAGPEPAADASKKDKIAYYRKNLGGYWKVGDTVKSQIGLLAEEDGRSFATHWVDDPRPLEEKIVFNKWDQWMNPGRMAQGATDFSNVFEIAADAIVSARVHLDDVGKVLSTEETALFRMAENAGTTIENLRVEDNEQHRTGGKPGIKKPPVGKGEIVDLLKMTPEFQVALTTQELQNFAVETKSSGIRSKPYKEPWQIFDPVATAAKWKHRIPTIEAVMLDVQLAYSNNEKVVSHAFQIEGIREVNRRMQNWELIGLCGLGI